MRLPLCRLSCCTAQRVFLIDVMVCIVVCSTPDTVWRNRDQFLRGTEEVRRFLQHKWAKEQQYKLKKELFAFQDNKIAVQFWYEYCPDPTNAPEKWRRCA